METNRMIAIAGPTAVGKTALALALAARLDGEIISCDSMQIYRGMDIGTAKPTPEEQAQVRHHMIDVADPHTSFSAADYAEEARKAVADIRSRCKTPIFCGGTGLYLESVFYESGFASPGADPDLRAFLAGRSPEENYRELQAVDPSYAVTVHPNNQKRVIRGLEVYRLSGRTKTEWDRLNRKKKLLPGAEIYVLVPADREALYGRIDRRVDEMLGMGLVEEVRRLQLSPESTAGQAIGYKELNNYIAGKGSLEAAVNAIKQASRNYAKRQLTWWGHCAESVMIQVTPDTDMQALADRLAQGSLSSGETLRT